MSLKNYGVANTYLEVDGREIDDLPENATYSIEYIANINSMRVGLNGKGIKMPRPNKPIRINIPNMPGTESSAYLQGLLNDGKTVSAVHQMLTGEETINGYDGVVVTKQTLTRGGVTADDVSNDVYVIEFVNSETKLSG